MREFTVEIPAVVTLTVRAPSVGQAKARARRVVEAGPYPIDGQLLPDMSGYDARVKPVGPATIEGGASVSVRTCFDLCYRNGGAA